MKTLTKMMKERGKEEKLNTKAKPDINP